MRFNRRSLWLAIVALFSAATIFAACTDGDGDTPFGPEGPDKPGIPRPGREIGRIECRASLAARTLTCATPGVDAGEASAAEVNLGHQGVNVRMISSNLVISADTFAFDAQIENLIPQALNTTDGTTPVPADSAGLRVFINRGPTTLTGSGTVTLANADGVDAFLTSDQAYIRYPDQIVAPGATSQSERWKFRFGPSVETFEFVVIVSAPVQFPQGWIDVTPQNTVLTPGGTVTLTGTNVNYAGNTVPGQPITWSSSNTAVATVNATTGEVTAVAKGTATITASSPSESPAPHGTRTGTATIVVNQAVVANDDAANAIGNHTLVAPAGALLANDTDADGDPITVQNPGTPITTQQGGTAVVNANGSFTYLSNAGFTGTDKFSYTIGDGVSTDAGEVTITVGGRVWYVQGSGSPGDPENGTGTDASPFRYLQSAETASGAGEHIFVRAGTTLTQGIQLDANQALIGQGIAAAKDTTLNGWTQVLLAAGAAPMIAPTGAGAAVTLGSNNTVRGLNLAPASGAGILGTTFGTLTANELSVAATGGPALSLTTGSVNAAFTSLSSVNSATQGLLLSGVSGTLVASGGSLSNSTGIGFQATGGDVTVGYPGSIVHSAAASAAISVDGHGGTITLTGDVDDTGAGILVQNLTAAGKVHFTAGHQVLNTGTAAAVRILNNATGSSIRFAGDSLKIVTTSGNGFTATSAGTPVVTVEGLQNSISTGTGTPVTISQTQIGADGVRFRSVSTTGTAANGIVLSNTGAGTFLAGGGTLTATGAAVSLTNTAGVELQGLALTGGSGIVGSSFGTLTTSGVSINATAGPALDLVTGTVAVGSTFTSVSSSSSASHGVRLSGVNGGFATTGGTVIGGAGAFPAFLLSGGNVAFTWSGTVSQGNAQPLLQVNGSHTGTATFQAGALTATQGTGLQFGQASGTYHLNGTTSLANGAGGNAGIDFANNFTGTVNVLPVSGHTALVQNPSGVAIDVAGGSGSLNYGGRVIQVNNVALLNVAGGHTGALSFASDTLRANNGSGLQFDNADGTYDFDGSVVLNGGDAAIDVTNTSIGTFTFTPAAGFSAIINDPANEAVRIVSSTPANFTYGGTITKDNNGNTGITITGSGGNITFSGASKVLNSAAGSGSGVNITTNSATVSFTNGGLAITTASGTGFNATGGGTVNIPDDGANTVASSSGVAVNIQNTNIGASDVVFDRVDASGGANGIALVNTGNTGGDFVVTGNGSTSGSGGSITNTTGADGAVAGNGVYLENTRNIDLRFLSLSGHPNHAIRGSGVVNFTLTKTRITGTNGTNAGFNEGSISFDNLTGTASITGSYVEGGFEDNVRVSNSSGTLNRLTMTSDTVGHNGNSGNDGLLLDGSGTATLNVTVQNSRFTGSRSNNVHYVLNGSAAGDFVFNNNVLTNNHPNKLGSDFGINVGSTSNGAMTYTVSGNTVNDAGGSGIEVSHLAGGSGAMTGSITGNTVGSAGVSNSGSAAGSTIVAAIVGAGTTATHTTTITGNTLRQFTNYGIRLINRGTGTGYLNATVKNNNIAVPSPNSVSGLFPTSGIRAELGATSGPPADDGKTCLDISGNTVNQTGTSSSAEIRVFGRFSTKTSLLGLGQGGASAVPNTFLQNQNTVTVAPGGFGAVNATSTNPFQSTCPPS